MFYRRVGSFIRNHIIFSFYLGLFLVFILLEISFRIIFVYNPITAEGAYSLNPDGYRDRWHAISKPEGVTRILCVGDSITYGYGLPFEHTYPHLLEEGLNQRQPGRYEVLIFAKEGLNTIEKFERFQAGLEYQPDMLIYQFHLNDVNWEYGLTRLPLSQRILIPAYALKMFTVTKIYLLEKFLVWDSEVDFFPAITKSYTDANSDWIETKRTFKRIVSKCNDNGIHPIMLLDQNINLVKDSSLYKTLEKVQNEAEQSGFYCIPIYKMLKREPQRDFRVHFTDFHPNLRYNQALVKILIEMIQNRHL